MITEDDVYVRLRELRGDCSCHISPPCHNCSEPMNADEAESILNHFFNEGRKRTDLLRLQQWFIDEGYEPRFWS